MPLHWKIGKYRESLKNGEKWTEKYQIEALQSVKNLFAEEVPENNIVCDISHFLHFADRAEVDIPNQSRLYAEYWWEMETFKMSVLEDCERLERPLDWEKWQRQCQSEAFELVKNLNQNKRKPD